MGKPTKPRVKGNLKPASSSRAAELAGGAGNSFSFENLGGFAQFAGAAPAVINSRPSTPSSMDNDMTDLDPELVVVLKKISKRDTVTKLKALEELETYLQSNQQVISVILHNWVTMYSKLVLEVDRRVRLVTNQVHTLITANAKKKLAPLLKELVGPWFLAMYDQSKDVARVAQKSFEAVFAEDKRLGVILFCQKEILDYVTDMVLFKTAETLSDVRYVSKEDMVSKHARVVASSFQIVSYLVTGLSIEERSKCQAEYDVILDDTTMWKKFFSNQSSLIRKALYTFLRTLLLNWIEMVHSRLDLICPHFYASVFTEKDTLTHSDMWDALLLMTKKLPMSWIIIGKKKPALPKLYHFLRSGLNGSITIAYPSLLALLANLPDELKNSPNFYADVFDNFWKGLSTEYFEKPYSNIFLSAYAECVVYFAITLSKSEQEQSHKSAAALIENTFWNLIKAYFLNLNDKLDISGYAILAKHLVVLASVNNCNKESMASFWSNLDTLLVQTIIDCSTTATRTPLNIDLFCQKTGHFLTAIAQQIGHDSKFSNLRTLLQDLSQRLLLASVESSLVHKTKACELLQLANQLLLISNVSTVESLVKVNQQLLQLLLIDEAENAIRSLASYYIGFIQQINDKQVVKELWMSLMKQLNTMMTEDTLQSRACHVLIQVLEHVYSEKMELDQCQELDTMVNTCAKLDGTVPRSVLDRITSLALAHSLSFDILFGNAMNEIIHTLKSNLIEFNQYQYIDKKSHVLPEPSVESFKKTLSALTILQTLFELDTNNNKLIQLLDNGNHGNFICNIFDAMFVTAKLHNEDENDQEQISQQITCRASALWNVLSSIENFSFADALANHVKRSITDIRYAVSPSESVRRVHKLLSSTNTSFTTLLGTEQEWQQLASPFQDQVTNNYLTLATLGPYAALSTFTLIEDAGELMPMPYDVFGLSVFGRLALFLGEYLSQKQLSPDNWSLRQLILTSMQCEQGLLVPGLCRIYEQKAVQGVQLFVQVTSQLFNDWLSATASKVTDVTAWHQKLLMAITTKVPTKEDDALLDLVYTLMMNEHLSSPMLLQRVMQRLMLLWDWQPSLMEQWLPFLKPEDTTLPLLTKVALLTSFKNSLSGNSAFQHYQSDLASKLSGMTKLSQLEEENSKHWRVLVLLNASSLKFGALDIPRQRLTYLMQALRPIMLQEDEFDDDQQRARAQAQCAQLLKHLALSMQDLSGSHWDFFLQCCFHWLACADTAQPEELLVVYHALDLLKLLFVEENNGELQEAVSEHWPTLSKVLLALMVHEQLYLVHHKEENRARLVYQTLLADLLAYIPQKTLIESDYFTQLNALIHTPNEVLQKRAYLLLQKFIAHRVQDLSVRLEFTDTNEEETHIDIDKDVLNVLLTPPDLSNWQNTGIHDEEEEQTLHETLAYLLTWMLMFDHFTDITFKLKQEYTAQLKEREAVSHLMSVLCKLLNIGQSNSNAKMFDLAPWSIVEYDTDGFDATCEMSFLVLASHLYYRALTHIPSLVRLWWIDCKHRQLTIAVENYTEKHFSQLLISNEMELVNRPDIKEQLEENDENAFTVKTLKAASEVTATYRVDEQNMQIAIKLPSNFPLRQIDVEGVQKVGVNDKQWRGWMFAVAAVIGSQNGNIVDALTVFKRNVNLHFNGVEDCTICYSIISIQDRSIPTKQCRTCKNKFHSSCLYKWFRSSNSASCPLCRTVF